MSATNIDRAADVIAQCWPNGRAVRKDDAAVLASELAKQGLIAITPPNPYLHPVTVWQAKCSECGYIEDDYGDFTAMDAVGVIVEVQAGGWELEGDRLVCDSCQYKEVEQ